MKILFQHIEQPTLNIESIGCYDPYADLRDSIRKPKKFYVASLDLKSILYLEPPIKLFIFQYYLKKNLK